MSSEPDGPKPVESARLRTRERVMGNWRADARWKAYGFIAASAAQTVSNKDLAKVLEMDPRGLRNVIERDPHFRVEIRIGDFGRGEPWYTLNPELKHGPEEPPKLIRLVTSKTEPIRIEISNSEPVADQTKVVSNRPHGK